MKKGFQFRVLVLNEMIRLQSTEFYEIQIVW